MTKDGVLCCGAQTNVECLVDTHKELFGEQPKEVHAPLDKDEKLELDDTPLIGPDGVKCHQTLIGAAQCLTMLSGFDIEGHLECLKCVIGHVQKHLHCAVGYCTGIPTARNSFERIQSSATGWKLFTALQNRRLIQVLLLPRTSQCTCLPLLMLI